MEAMANLLQALETEVERFRTWADTNPVPVAQRSGVWECDYPGWSALYHAFTEFAAATRCRGWNETTAQMVLYALARDNDNSYLIRELAKNPDDLLCLAERAVNSTESDAKWQIAAELGLLGGRSPQVESLLMRFARDDDAYVRRRAVITLANIGSIHAADLAEELWSTEDEYQRMSALYALWKIGSPLLEDHLEQAEADPRPDLAAYAARVRADIPE